MREAALVLAFAAVVGAIGYFSSQDLKANHQFQLDCAKAGGVYHRMGDTCEKGPPRG